MSDTATQDGIPISEAATQMGRSEATLRRWIRKGAPTVRLGETGREGSLVILDDIKLWRAGLLLP